MKISRGYCKECKAKRKVVKETRSFALDVVAIVLTFGLYLFVMILRGNKKWRCDTCGSHKIKMGFWG